MRDQHPMDEFFARKLADHTIPVTDDMWNRIASGIEKKRRRYLWIWLLAGTVILSAGFGGYILFLSDPFSNDNNPEANNQLELAINEPVIAGNDPENSDETKGSSFIIDAKEGIISSNSNQVSDKELNTNIYLYNINKSEEGPHSDPESIADGISYAQEVPVDEKINPSEQDEMAAMKKVKDSYGGPVQPGSASTKRSDIIRSEGKVALDHSSDPAFVQLPGSISSAQFSMTKYNSMKMPRVRNIRDRNCEDEAFSAGRTFLEFSYGLQQGNVIFRSTGPQFDDYRDFRSAGETWKNGTHLQALIGFQMGNRLFFKTGISYNRVTTDYRFVDQINKRSITDSIWNPVKNDWDVIERQIDIVISGTNSYTFVDIPLLLSYGFQFNKLGVAVTAGPMVNLSFAREGQLPDFEGKGIDLSGGVWNDREIYRKTAGINLFTSVQLSYQTYRNVELFVEPRLVLPMNSLTLENDGREPDIAKISYPISQRLFQYGVGIGLRYSITK